MIPYVPAPVFWIGGRQISAFGVLLILAFFVGTSIAIRRAARLQIDGEKMWRMCFWAVACGLAGAHVAKMAMDYTPQFLADPYRLRTLQY
jgi:prolipoprotein diacylglyceryltransferase